MVYNNKLFLFPVTEKNDSKILRLHVSLCMHSDLLGSKPDLGYGREGCVCLGGGGGGNSETFWAGVCRWNFEYTPYSYNFQSDKNTYLYNLHVKRYPIHVIEEY